jgi:hypothetical protein
VGKNAGMDIRNGYTEEKNRKLEIDICSLAEPESQTAGVKPGQQGGSVLITHFDNAINGPGWGFNYNGSN